jgi:cytochrome c553
VIVQLAAAALSLLAAADSSAADADAGAKKAAETCAACHGETGNSENENVPSLAGHSTVYTTLQLVLFREKQRLQEVMSPFAAELTDQQIENLATFYAAQTPEPGPTSPPDPNKMQRGKALADARHCGSCHLPDYGGREQMARLAGQREDYLLKAMTDYRNGERAGLDGMMTEVLHGTTDEQLADLAHFLAHQR